VKKQLITYVKKWKEAGALTVAGARILSIADESIKEGFDQDMFLRLGAFLAIVLLLYVIAWYLTRPYRVRTQIAMQNTAIPKCRMVISGLSPLDPRAQNIEVITNLVRHHSEKLEALVLVCTPLDEGVQNAINALKAWLNETYPAQARLLPDRLVILVPVQNTDDIAEMVSSVSAKIDQAAISPKEIYVDITAGLKTFSVALMLVAQEYGSLLSYQVSQKDESGRAIPGTARLTLLKLGETVSRTESS